MLINETKINIKLLIYCKALRGAIMKEELIEQVLLDYSDKIFGFCLVKTSNVFEAEDLAQIILMNLFTSLKKQNEITNLDGYIYKFCFYTWSNFVRENIKYWQTPKID